MVPDRYVEGVPSGIGRFASESVDGATGLLGLCALSLRGVDANSVVRLRGRTGEL